jgi:hypothetical protein
VLRAWGLAAAIMTAGIGAQAQDAALLVNGPDDASAPDNAREPTPEQFLLFSGVEFWRASAAAYGGLHWAPGGLNDDGLIARVLLSRQVDHYGPSSNAVFRGSALAGLRVKHSDFELKLMLGPLLESNEPTSPAARLRGTRLGLQAIAETWWEPTPMLMLASSWSATTLGSGYGGRVAAGWRLFGTLWSGPEVSAFTDEDSTQYRVGLHLTGVRWQDLEWSAAVGYLRDSYHREGAYARLGVLLRR